MNIVCDCDLVIAPADKAWLAWLNAVSNKNVSLPTMGKQTPYDLSEYFPDFQEKFGVDPHSFWDNSQLYDMMDEIPGAGQLLRYFAREGDANILIASHTKGGHFSSKFRYVKRVLPTVDFGRGTGNGFFATKEKYILPCSVAIDDRAENLVLFPDNVLKIYFNTIYEDPYLEELQRLPNVLITSIKNPWLDIYHSYLEGQWGKL